jgi:short-subunit dehydrogenase
MPRVRLDGRRVLLTGAAGGIGRAIARDLHGRGASLLLSGRNVAGLEALAEELGARAEPVPADLSRREDVDALARRASGADVLVANAALPASGPLDGFSSEEIDRALDVNLRAPVQLARALVPAMVERGAGHLVLISSFSGKVATSGSSLYSATKFGLRGFASGLRQDLLGTGVGVTTVFPGLIREAGMFADTGLEVPRLAGSRTPHDVAAAVVRGIEKDVAEIDVAPLAARVSARVSGAAPGLVAALGRRLGSAQVAAAIAERQRDKR